MLPESAMLGLRRQLEIVSQYHEESIIQGIDHVSLPFALSKKYPNAGK